MAPPRRSPPEADAKAIQANFAAWRNLQRSVNRDWPTMMRAVTLRARGERKKLR